VASRRLEFLVPLPFYCNFAYFKIASIKGTVGASHVSKVNKIRDNRIETKYLCDGGQSSIA
jgi:hypothetical protein